jgi:hypothetical protein
MPHLSVDASFPRITYAGPGAGPYPVPFAFSSPAALVVYANGVRCQYVSGSPATATQFSVSGVVVDGGYQEADITFGGAAAGPIVILRRTALGRTTDFPYPSSTLDIKALNTELDRIAMQVEDASMRADRSLALADTDAPASLAIPPLSARANRALGFNSAGEPIALAVADGSTLAAGYGSITAYGTDTAGFNAFASQGGGYVPPGVYTITGDVTLPAGAVLHGFDISYGENRGLGQYQRGTVLKMAPGARIRLGEGASLRNVAILNSALPYPPANASDAQARINSFSGVAIAAAGADVCVQNVLVIGFDRAFQCIGYERPLLIDFRFDCANGVEVSNCTDVARIVRCHAWQYYIAHNPALGTAWALTQRSGIAYNFYDVVDGLDADVFAFGWNVGVRLKAIGLASVTGGIDNAISVSNNNVGVLVEGACGSVDLGGMWVSSCKYNADFANTSGHITASGLTLGLAQTAKMRLRSGSQGSIGILEMGGNNGELLVQAESGVGRWAFGAIRSWGVSGATPMFVFGTASDIERMQVGAVWTDIGNASNNIGSRLEKLTIHPNGFVGWRNVRGEEAKLVIQNDDNLVLYSTDAAGAARTIFGIKTHDSNAPLAVAVQMQIATGTYADEAAATSAGLASGTLYKTSTGSVRIKL